MPQHEGFSWLPFWEHSGWGAEPRKEGGVGRRAEGWSGGEAGRKFNQSILKEISPEYLEGMMLKLKLQYLGHLIQITDSFEKTLILGKIEGGRRRGRQRMSW